VKKITLLNVQNNENGSEMRFDQHIYDYKLSVKCIFDLCDKMENICATLFYTPWQKYNVYSNNNISRIHQLIV